MYCPHIPHTRNKLHVRLVQPLPNIRSPSALLEQKKAFALKKKNSTPTNVAAVTSVENALYILKDYQ